MAIVSRCHFQDYVINCYDFIFLVFSLLLQKLTFSLPCVEVNMARNLTQPLSNSSRNWVPLVHYPISNWILPTIWWVALLVCLDYHSKIPQIGWLKQLKLILSQSRRLRFLIKVMINLLCSKNFNPDLKATCSHMVFSLYTWGKRESSLVSPPLLRRTLILLDWAPLLKCHLTSITSLGVVSPSRSHWELELQP